ncbi:4-hydroxy-tetrahydrodipicolinate synthase [Sediminispirochaeta smaragdinae]|uniref:4-hydroxy-tetrahydrodipicolinate synthase n=1 Tax=Sediminispirochaeta smaragdinae (strain DSM 11293 / JCM 15392 / SEBR 4228) TaxID=573413 RepID=E1RC47_SEDSS|nr:4-hydroxy-tetrahydrodipicolinate synthase [Sediminispirochaeta smaragdinae]ADK79927.1 dihydrodipicolinate synthase [Sediminispirochaeta smaragdinae DSM 11293]
MKKFNKKDYGKILIPMVTPFKENQEVDYEKAVKLAQFLIDTKKGDTLVLSGTTGEFHTMVFSERVELFRIFREKFAAKIPMIAGVGAASTKETIELAKAAEKLGFETIMAVAPYYTKPNQKELYEHYKALSEAVDVNVMIYNIPIFTGVNVKPETVGKLSEYKNIVAIKEEAELNAKQMTEFINATPSDFIIYNGDDTMILEAYTQGGDKRIGGVISGQSHIFGDKIRTMINTFLSGDIEAAALQQQQLLPVFRIMGQNNRTNPVALLKDTMKLYGIDGGYPRRPLSPGTPEEIATIKALLVKQGLLA